MNLKYLPKIELHRHLELSVRHSTIKALAPKIGVNVDTEEDFANNFLITEPMKDLGSVLNKFLDTQKLFFTEDIIEQISYEICEDAFNEGIKILELRYAPTFLVMGHDKINFEQAHLAIVRGIKRAEKDFKMAVGLLCIIQRISPLDVAESVTDFAIDHKDTFIGLDLADNEEGFDSKPFSSFFMRAKKAGLGITVHAGESDVPNAPRYILEAIEHLGATRIGHGVQCYRDESVIKQLIDQKIPLELCPTSNWLTGAIKDKNNHPFKSLMDKGILTTISSDDPGIFNIDLTHEYELLQNKYGLTEQDFQKCNKIAFDHSFIPLDKKMAVWI